MKKRKREFIPMILIMIIIFTVGVIGNNNKDFLKKVAENLKLTQVVIFYETGMKFFDMLDTNINFIFESNFIPENTDDKEPNKTEDVNLQAKKDMKNQTSKDINVTNIMKNDHDLKIDIKSKEPQVLIVHTHGTESYTKNEQQKYEESGDSRTINPNFNVVKVGETLTENLNDAGIKTIHATELHDYPSYTGSYDRTRETIDKYLKENPSIKMVIDVHRDAIIKEDGTHFKPVTSIDGKDCAQLMMVVGTDDGGLLHESWKDNLNFSLKLQEQISKENDGLMRTLDLRSSRFNQDMVQTSFLLEVGASGNSLNEALNSINLFSEELIKFIKGS